MEENYKQLKEEVKMMLTATSVSKLSEALHLVDTFKRLGFSYHFEEEICEILKQINNVPFDYHESIRNDSLHIISLRFRLLREEGYHISSGIVLITIIA